MTPDERLKMAKEFTRNNHPSKCTCRTAFDLCPVCQALVALLARVERGAMAGYPFHVYPGSEKMDLGPKGSPQVLCQSRPQAEHMARFWGEAGYYEEVK